MDRIRLEMKHISIEFLGVRALDGINFEVSAGEIRVVVDAGDVGKSTLTKVLAGANSMYSGEILLNGKKVEVGMPVDAEKLEIQIMYQEVNIVLYSTLSAAENIVQNDMVMGKSGYIVNWKRVYKQGHGALNRLRIDRDQVDEYEPVQNLSLVQKQMVLITKAIWSECNFLILDEPTAPLNSTETEELFRTVKHLHETENTATSFTSHQLNEILEVCKNYTVMRNGRVIDTTPVTGETTAEGVVEKTLGRKFEESSPREACQIDEVLPRTENLSGTDGKVKDMSAQAEKDEVVGITGLAGAGKSELRKTVFGAYKKTGGEVLLENQELKIASSPGATKNWMALVPEKRCKEGVLVNESVSFNLSAARLPRFCTGPFIRRWKVDDNAKRFVKGLGVSTPSARQQVKNLSGGNQQKMATRKWLAAGYDVYIFDEPTKGAGAEAEQDISHLISEIAKQGNCVTRAFCENSELLSLTDHTYVMYSGMVIVELETAKTTENEIMFYSVSGKDSKNGK